MSKDSNKCTYVLDPADPRTWGGEERDECRVRDCILNERKKGREIWSCPHEPVDGKDLCIFHLPVSEKDDEEVVETLAEVISSAAELSDTERRCRQLQFINAKFGNITFRIDSIDRLDNSDVLDFSHAEFGDVDLQDVTIKIPILFRGAIFENSADFRNSIFDADVNFSGAQFRTGPIYIVTTFRQKADFEEATFESASFAAATFEGHANFIKTVFNGRATFDQGVVFEGDTEFYGATFSFIANFRWAEFKGKAGFSEVTFKGTAMFSETTFGGEVLFNEGLRKGKFTEKFPEERWEPTTFHQHAVFNKSLFDQPANFSNILVKGRAGFSDAIFCHPVDFTEARFEGSSHFSNVLFGRKADFTDALFGTLANFKGAKAERGITFLDTQIDGSIDFQNSRLTDSEFQELDLSDANFSRANLAGANLEHTRLNRAQLLGANLVGTRLNYTLLGDAQINRKTQFWPEANVSLHDLRPYPASCIGGGWWRRFKTWLRRGRLPYCRYDPRYGDLNRENISAGAADSDSFENENDRDEVSDSHQRESEGKTDDELSINSAEAEVEVNDELDPIPKVTADDVDLEKAAEVYSSLESLARDNGHSQLASEAFISRKDVQRRQHKEEGRLLWQIRATVPNLVARYGESPWRVLYSGGVIVLFSGLMYWLFDLLQKVEGAGGGNVTLFESIYFSSLTFTTLGYGDFRPANEFGQFLAVLETASGVTLLAILVFVFGRRATR